MTFLTKRRLLAAVVMLGLFSSGADLLSGPATPLPDKSPPADVLKPTRATELADALTRLVRFSGFDDPKTTLIEALDQFTKRFNLAFAINEKAFKDENVPDVAKTEIAQPTPIPGMNARLSTALNKVLSRVPAPSGATYLIRKDFIEITTRDAVRAELGIPKDRPLLPLVWETFQGNEFETALERLASATGFNTVLDQRVRDKAKTPVTARLFNVPVDTAVRILANMEDLEPVRLDNVLYVTTPENAARLRAEQQRVNAPKPTAREAGAEKPKEKAK